MDINKIKPILYGVILEIVVPVAAIIFASMLHLKVDAVAFIAFLGCRLASFLIMRNYCNYYYKIQNGKVLWLIASVVFGGWSLIALNIYQLYLESEKVKQAK